MSKILEDRGYKDKNNEWVSDEHKKQFHQLTSQIKSNLIKLGAME